MRRRDLLTALFALPLALAALGCSGASGEAESALRSRAGGFGDLLVELRDIPDGEAGDRLEGFLEPGPDRRDRATGYLRESRSTSGKYRVIASSVRDVELTNDGSEGLVVFSVRARGPQGQELAALQQTHWLLVDGEWFRSSRPAARRLDG